MKHNSSRLIQMARIVLKYPSVIFTQPQSTPRNHGWGQSWGPRVQKSKVKKTCWIQARCHQLLPKVNKLFSPCPLSRNAFLGKNKIKLSCYSLNSMGNVINWETKPKQNMNCVLWRRSKKNVEFWIQDLVCFWSLLPRGF